MSKKYTTNFLEDTNGSTGSANQVLVSTATGIDWVDGSGSGIIGGPYLPLTGGTITGDLNITNSKIQITAGAPEILLSVPSGGLDSRLYNDGGGNFFIGHGTNGATPTVRLAVTSAGNVGIGTTSPASLLHLSSSFPEIRLQDNAYTATNHYSIIEGNGGSGVLTLSADDSNAAANSAMVFKVDATEKMRIASNGNVGIGTTSPSYALDIERATGEVAIQLQARDNTSNTAIYFGDNNDADVGSLIYNQGSNYMSFTTNAGERMRITSAGNVGIGTGVPSYTLEVNGKIATNNGGIVIESQDIYSNSEYSGNDGSVRINRLGYLGGTTKFRDTVIFNGKGSQIMTIDGSSGNVGIGTTSPGAKLAITQTTAAEGLRVDGASGGFALIVNGGTSYKTIIRNASVGNGYGGNTPPANGLIVEGNVGIGTTNPTYKLDVQGGGVKIVDNSYTDYFLFKQRTDASQKVGFKTPSGGGLEMYTNDIFALKITPTQNVGIGTTSPGARLHVYNGNASIAPNGDGDELVVENSGNAGISILTGNTSNGAILFGDAQDNNVGIIDYDHSVNQMSFTTGASRAVTINASQNVGIGTTNPSYKLDVNGTANISGAATMAGPVKMVGLSQYADDVAAGNAGLQTGDLYYSLSGGDRVIKMKI